MSWKNELWGPANINLDPQTSVKGLLYTAIPEGRIFTRVGLRFVFLIPISNLTSDPPIYGGGGVQRLVQDQCYPSIL